MREELLNVPLPRLDRLMALRDALVALKGPLANDAKLREDLHERLFNEEANNRVLGKLCTPAPTVAGPITFGDTL